MTIRVTRVALLVVADDARPPIDLETVGASASGGSAALGLRIHPAVAAPSVSAGAGTLELHVALRTTGPSVSGGAATLGFDTRVQFQAVMAATSGGQATLSVYEPGEFVTKYVDRLLEQFKRKPKLEAFLVSWLREFEQIRNTARSMRAFLQIDNAQGAQLDAIGKLLLQPRYGLEDDLYLRVIKARLQARLSKGRSADFYRVLLVLFAGTDVTFTVRPGIRKSLTIEVRAAPNEAIDPALLVDLLQDAAAAGEHVGVVYSQRPGRTFRFAPAAVPVTDADHGFGDLTGETGGGFAGAYQ